MTYARKTLSEIKLIHGNYGNFIKGQKLDKKKEKKYKTPPYQDLAASNEIDGEPLDEKCWPGYEKKGMKTMFGKRYPNCVKKKKTRKEDFSDWRSDLGQIDEKAVSKQQQKFFGMVRATQKGEMDNPSDEVQKAADSMTKKDVKKYASTKHSKLPDKIEEKLDSEDKPFVKKLVGKLRKGSKTHAKQADDLEKAMNEDITDEALTIQDWNKDDIKFTEIETVDIIKAKPLKENQNLDEGIKRKIIKKLAKKIAKQLGKNKPKVTGDVKKYVPPSKDVVQNIQTKSIINQVKKASDLSSKPVKGTKPVKVDVSKLNIDKYFGATKPSSGVKKKFVSKRPTGTFTDDAPKVKRETLIKAKPGEAAATEKLIKKYEIGDKIEKKYPGRENAELKKKMFKRLFGESNWREELGEDWQKVNRKDKTDGLSKAAVKAYRRENPGSKLQTAVTKDPKKLKKGSKSAKRRLSFCRRMKGMKKKLTSAKTRRDPDSRINKALRRWNC
jgi:hypothetical protein